MIHRADMDPDRLAFLKSINAAPRDRTRQLIFADWLQDHGDTEAERFWRKGGGRGGIYNPENQVVLIPGENALIFMPNGYGFSVLLGRVDAEYPHGWVVDPCREVLDTHNGDCWVKLAAGDKALR